MEAHLAFLCGIDTPEGLWEICEMVLESGESWVTVADKMRETGWFLAHGSAFSFQLRLDLKISNI